MKRKFLLSIALMLMSITGFSTVWVINTSGFTFSPATITIQVGDSVNFLIGGGHDAREVSQTTWNSNGNAALIGGFQTPFGGTMILPSQLGVGTHFYVCSLHNSMGMKGTIIVQNTIGIDENSTQASIFVSPNPSQGKFQLSITSDAPVEKGMVEVFDVTGKSVFQSEERNTIFDLDLTKHAKGAYFIKFYNRETTLTKKIIVE
ncbi:MAG: T9SS type A sorting domain-containing protein [Bacteroidetes bacterium]|nr:T9SS type A sorting domain-containing protein [Bacteroidota bacterium]